jgi:molybdate transport system substrate-binding protein
MTLAAAALLLASVTAAAPEPVTVAAAASLRPAVEEAARAFEAAHPGSELRLAFGASGAFFAQIRSGAPIDLFLSADREYPAQLVAAGLARAEDEIVYAAGRLVAWTPPGSALDLPARGLGALADPSVRRIAIANPAVAPYGRAAEAALRAAGVWDAVKARLVLGQSVAQAAQFAETGAADAALLPRSLALLPALARGRAWEVPPGSYPRVAHSGVVVKRARHPALARAFLDYLAGPGGRAVLAAHGLDPP